MYQREVVRRRHQQSMAPANVRLEVVSISWETGVVWCTCKIPACILKATFSSSDTKRFVVLRAVLPNSGRVLVGVQQWSTPKGVATTKGVVYIRRVAGGQGCFSREENKIMLRILKNLHVLVRASGSGVPDTFPSQLRRSGPYLRAGSQHWHLVRLRRRKGCPRMLL